MTKILAKRLLKASINIMDKRMIAVKPRKRFDNVIKLGIDFLMSIFTI